jgi:hypothetical protein
MSIILLDYIDNVAIALPSRERFARCAKRLNFLRNFVVMATEDGAQVAKLFVYSLQLFLEKEGGRAPDAARQSRNQ